MVEIILTIMLFILGAYMGSFFTLATYRIPKNEDITHKHSYCPNCNHKLGLLDLVPIFSYLFLKGKCRYCKEPISVRYILFEVLTGIVVMLFGLSLKIDVYNLSLQNIIYFFLALLYIASLFILAGINKEKNIIEKPVLFFGIFISILYMIYSYAFNFENTYAYVIYLFMMIILISLDTITLKRKLKYYDWILILILILYMFLFTGNYITITTLIFTILIVGIMNILNMFCKKKAVKVNKKEKKPIVFYLCVSNIILLIATNFMVNYMLK